MTYGRCELRTCCYNRNCECVDEAARRRCIDVCSAVLGNKVKDFFETKRKAEDDLR